MSGYVQQTIDLASILSPEALAALKELAIGEGIGRRRACSDSEEEDQAVDEAALTRDLIGGLKNHFDRKKFGEKEQTFNIQYGSVEFSVKGVKQNLGQTLDSTGLTIWRAAEHLCEYIMRDPSFLKGRHVCELGGGLGVVSILVHKLDIASSVVCTDGDDISLELLRENALETGCTEQGMLVDKLYWGDHDSFLQRHPSVDLLLAADVVYEQEQIEPLLTTAVAILKQAELAHAAAAAVGGDAERIHTQPTFILAYARRNVPIDRVFECAHRLGLIYLSLDGDVEPIVQFTLKPPHASGGVEATGAASAAMP